jgi:hypothetical protein
MRARVGCSCALLCNPRANDYARTRGTAYVTRNTCFLLGRSVWGRSSAEFVAEMQDALGKPWKPGQVLQRVAAVVMARTLQPSGHANL